MAANLQFCNFILNFYWYVSAQEIIHLRSSWKILCLVQQPRDHYVGYAALSVYHHKFVQLRDW